MTMQNITSGSWNETYLSPEDLLDEIEGVDEVFQTVYSKSLSLTKLLLPDANYLTVEQEYIAGVNDFNEDIQTVDGLIEELWGGYHPTVHLFIRLKWYGIKGIYHYSDAESPLGSQALSNEISLAENFLDLIATTWISKDTTENNIFEEILEAAKARFNLDAELPLNFDQIVALSGMSKRAVQNDIAKDAPGSLALIDNQIQNKQAKLWLKERRNFIPTKPYLSAEHKFQAASEKKGLILDPIEEYLFIPVADDNTEFLPELKREKGYQVGKYGEETYYLDYYDALSALQEMDVPRFRRPNDKGQWGIKTCTGWKRIPKKLIERLSIP